jgi:hypothetical protein
MVQFVGANAIGPNLTVVLNNVMFRSTGRIGFIQEEYGNLQVIGEVLADGTGVFGTVTHPDTTAVSPLVSQYYVGKGIVSVRRLTAPIDAAYVDAGDVSLFEFIPAITTLQHYSSRHGVRVKDQEVIREMAATVEMTMSEFTYRNLNLALMGP